MKQRKGCRISCDVGKAAGRLKIQLWRRWSDVRVGEWGSANPYIGSPTSQLIFQHFRRFTYVTADSTDLPLLHLRHRHFTYVTAHSTTSAAWPTSQLILKPFRRFTYVTRHSTTLLLFHLRHRHFTYFTWRATHPYGAEKNSVWWTSLLVSLEEATVVKNFTTSSKLILL